LLIVLGTSSSESALPSLMEKLERLGCSKSVVGLVVPTGYSFNLDGTNIYMTLATLFIAQALGFELTMGQQITILLVAMLTSKGASGITEPALSPSRRRWPSSIRVWCPAWPSFWHRQVHERMSRLDEPLRQWCRVRGGVVVGGRTQSGEAARQSQQGDRSVGRGDRPHDGLAEAWIMQSMAQCAAKHAHERHFRWRYADTVSR
jgi:hypothetical protein